MFLFFTEEPLFTLTGLLIRLGSRDKDGRSEDLLVMPESVKFLCGRTIMLGGLAPRRSEGLSCEAEKGVLADFSLISGGREDPEDLPKTSQDPIR